ncbi:MAG TPA: response regulator [Tepidisphaeraceae bacterium]|jgi:FixJ family two-component response regulator
MAPTKVSQSGKAQVAKPRVLVVDDEAELIEVITDTVGKKMGCKLIAARSVAAAKKVLESQQRIDLLLTDVNLPDGDGMSLLGVLHLHQPQAQAIVMTGQASMSEAIEAMREGASDFVPKPFSTSELADRVKRALARAAASVKTEKRLVRLRDAVKRLNDARKMVSKKVDLLCNDLISAYGELSKQLDLVRIQESYKHCQQEAKDLEQLLCHTMDWLLRQIGYSNIAVWLAGDDDDFQLGAYMKYTTPGEPALTEALRTGIVKHTVKENCLHLSGDELRSKLTAKEMEFLKDQDVITVNCSYLAESLAVVVMFREAKGPFTEEDYGALKAVSPLFAVALAGIVRGSESEEDGDNGTLLDEDNKQDKKDKKERKKKDDADWWKRGEEPPF